MNDGLVVTPHIPGLVSLADSSLSVAANLIVAVGFFCLPIIFLPVIRRLPAPNSFRWFFGAFTTTCGLIRVVSIWSFPPNLRIATALTLVAAIASFGMLSAILRLAPDAWLRRFTLPLRLDGERHAQRGRTVEQVQNTQRFSAPSGASVGEIAPYEGSLAEAMPHAVFTATPAGNITYCNRAWYDYTGLTEAQTYAGDWNAVLHPEDMLRCTAAWVHAVQNGEPYEVVMRLRRASDRSYRSMLCRATPAFDATGRIVRWIGSCIDIHDLKRSGETRHVRDALGHLVSRRSEGAGFSDVGASRNQCYGSCEHERADFDWRFSIHPDDIDLLDRQSQPSVEPGRHVEQREIRLRAADGRYHWFLARRVVPHGADAIAKRSLNTQSEIDGLTSLTGASSDSDLRYRALTDAMPQLISIVDEQANVEYVNASWGRYTGLPFEHGMGSKTLTPVHPDDLPVLADAHHSLRSGQSYDCELRMRRNDGVYRWHLVQSVPLGERHSGTKWVVTATDIEAYKSAEAALANSAAELTHREHHDALTNLPNRIKLMDRLTDMIAEAERDGTDVIVLYLDIDHFKSINDTLGHNSGDALLVETAARINGALRAEDTASRFGGDEFVVICTAAGGDEAPQIAERLALAVRAPIVLDGKRVVVGSSIGFSVFPQDGGDAADLIQKADAAMHAAKESGRNAWCSYSAQTHLPAPMPALEFEAELREAIALEQFVIYYQPIISVETGRPMGAEALVRWDHPQRGLLAPGEFIPFAENHGLIAPIGELVLNAACSQLQRLNLRSGDHFTIAVNVSARQFAKPGFVATIAAAISAHGLDARRLEIEITESVVMGDTAGVIATLDELQGLGVKLSIDDFGTGYSSLAYIKNFPIHTLKIDRSFVSDIAFNFTDQAIAKTIVTLAHSLGMRVVAEGVETTQQLEQLRAFGADCIQGYLISRPLSAADFEDFLADRRSMIGRSLKRVAS